MERHGLDDGEDTTPALPALQAEPRMRQPIEEPKITALGWQFAVLSIVFQLLDQVIDQGFCSRCHGGSNGTSGSMIRWCNCDGVVEADRS